MIKFFFMAKISANLQGKPQVQFNTISALDTRNITAAGLNQVQEAAARMITPQGIPFDDLVIDNIFCLTPDGLTEEEFVAGTQLRQQLEEASAGSQAFGAEVEGGADELEANASLIGTGNDLSELDAQAVEATPVDDVTTADVKTED